MTQRDQSFVVFGGTSFVARSLARRIRARGGNLLLTARTASAAAALAEEFSCETAISSADDSASIEGAVQQAVARFGKIDGVANCMGSVLLKPAHLTTDTEWHETLTVNLTSSFVLIRAAVKAMRSEGGSIVLISSAAAKIGLANHEAIAAAKAGIIGLTLSAAATYAGRGIRVNAVSPGLVKSEITRKLWETEAAAAASMPMHALGRLGEPDDIAQAIAWLLDPENSWITGQTISVDGGLSSIVPRAKV
ncbi:MAG: SDR family oxidoreductase [Planctomycetaceae bacterium]|nr:SDR family oxidoreductase [Planctomycetaceae bacterium]